MRINNFDMLVLGKNLGALIAAAFLCKNGHRVLIIENEDKRWTRSPLLDKNATTFISGCDSNRLVYNIFRELNVPIHNQKKFAVKELSYQIALPECRIDVGSSWNLYYQEMKREFPRDLKKIGEMYREAFKCDKLLNEIFYNYLLYPQKFSARLKSSFIMHLENVLKINDDNSDFSAFLPDELKQSIFTETLDLQLSLLNKSSCAGSSMSSLFLLSAFQRGFVQEPDRLSTLKEILLKQITKTHGEFLQVTKVESIHVSKRNPLKDTRGIVLKYAGQKRPVEGKVLLCGQPIYSLPNVINDIKLGGRMKRLVKRFTPTSANLTFTYKIDRWGIPVGLRSRVLFSPGKGKRGCIISVAEDGDSSSTTGTNDYLLKASIVEPFNNGVIRKERLVELEKEVVGYLKELIPFYDDFVTPYLDTAFEDIKLEKLSSGDFIYGSSFLKNLSLGEVESCELLKNIYFAGREFLPQLGVEGEIISGWRAANMIIRKLR